MKLLLDTHVWLWAHLEPDRLSARSRNHLVAETTELWLSPISIWEALILIERARVQVDAPGRKWVESLLRAVPLRVCALTPEVALVSREVELSHEDPADRFLAASAIVHELTLLTADSRLLGSERIPTLRAT